ncbi:MAG: VWA domain-containing protein [Gemmatimonadetes bacterium]|nr:VWA domain-containing protein [Gemmatimonadota bacterium]
MLHTLTVDYHHLPARQGYMVRALLELQGVARTEASRIPLRLALVLDRSGSMAGEPLEAATRAAADLVRRLAPDDVVSVVAFDDQVRTVLRPHSGADGTGAIDRILAIQPGGCTNLSGGWLRGRELASKEMQEGALHRVLLLTDGHANAGITDPAELAALVAESRRKGVSTSCVGFGEGYDEPLLRALADAGGGNLFHIERPDQSALAFGDELAGLQTLAGQNVEVTVSLDPAVTIARVHHDWPHTDSAEGRTFELGDLYAREPKRLLLEFFCEAVPDATLVRALARLTVRADEREADGGMAHITTELTVAATLDGAGQEAPVITREVLLSQAAQARTEAAAMVRRGEGRDASRKLREVHRVLESAPPMLNLAADVKDLEALAAKLERDSGDEMDARYLMQKAYNSRRSKRKYDSGFSR